MGKTLGTRFWDNVAIGSATDCWEWTAARNRYGIFYVGQGQILAHRMSWALHRGPIPDGMRVLHHCDNPPCVNPSHLFLGTQADNVADMHAKGRDRKHRGATHHNAVLTPSLVLAIRYLQSGGMGGRRIGRLFGVSGSAIDRIREGKTWAHVQLSGAPQWTASGS